jgi:hypothetical protein
MVAVNVIGTMFYTFEALADLYLAAYFFPLDYVFWKELWMKEYGIVAIDLEGTGILATTESWASPLNAALGLPQYDSGVQCPCINRDGYGQPYPICPDP